MEKTKILAAAAAVMALTACGGKKSDPLNQFLMESMDTDLVPVEVYPDGEFGYLGKDGKLVINATFRHASFFHNGLAAVLNADDRFGYINTNGEMEIKAAYVSACDFSDGMAWVAEPDSALAAIDKNGNVKFRFPKAEEAEVFLDGYSRYTYADNTCMGLVDKKGIDIALPDTCRTITACGDGYFLLVTRDMETRLGKISEDKIEYLAVNLSLDIKGFSSEYRLIKVSNSDGRFGLADIEGKIVVNPRYKTLDFDMNGLILIENDKEKYGWINPEGDEVIPARYTDVNKLFMTRDYTAVSTTGSKFQVINRNGKTLVGPRYDRIRVSQTDGILFVCKDDKWGIIDTRGNVLCDPQFDNLANISNSMVMATSGDSRWGLIDEKGTYCSKIDYHRPQGNNSMLLYARSNFFDPAALYSQINSMASARMYYDRDISDIAAIYALAKSDLENAGHDIVVKTRHNRVLDATLELHAVLNGNPTYCPSYWSSRREFNKNAKVTDFYITATFSSPQKCTEAFNYIRKQSGIEVLSEPDDCVSFIVNIPREGSLQLESGAEDLCAM